MHQHNKKSFDLHIITSRFNCGIPTKSTHSCELVKRKTTPNTSGNTFDSYPKQTNHAVPGKTYYLSYPCSIFCHEQQTDW